jgi:hypothetical protein
MQDPCENFNTLMKEIQEDPNKCRHIQCSWIRKLNIVKMLILLKLTYRFKENSIKFPSGPSRETDMLIMKCMKMQRS